MPSNDLAAAVERLRRVQNGETMSGVYDYTCHNECDYDHLQTLHDIDRNAVANAYLAREDDDAKPVDRETERQLKDATMFMRRMARCIDKDHPIRIAAQNWLIREGLQGSPLRNSETNGGE